MKRVLDWLTYVVLRLLFGVLQLLPLSLAYFLGRSLAWVVFYLDGRHRRIGLVNLEFAFPDKSLAWKNRVLRQSFGQLADQIVELSRISEPYLKKQVSYESGRGLEHYLEAKKGGRSIIFVTAHISAWELLPSAHSVHGNPLSFLVRPLDNPYLEAWWTRLRTRFGNRVVAKQHSLRRVMRLLSAGEDIGFLIDQNVQPKDGVFAPFFGQQASTSSAPAALALKLRLPVIAGFMTPTQQRGRYQIRFYPPIYFDPEGGGSKAVVKATSRLNELIEEVLREFPHCWLWGHRRFHTQPGGKDLYSEGKGLH